MPSGGASILIVCAANVCRSPMAALTLRRALGELAGFEHARVASAGLSAASHRGVCSEVAGFHDDEEWRDITSSHRPRALEAGHVLDASVVLAATRGIRSSIVSAVPERRDRVFTLREALWLGEGFVRDAGARGDDAVEAFYHHLDRGRGLRPAPTEPRRLPWSRRPGHPADITDGHQLRAGAHRSTVREVDRAARAIASLISGSPAPRA